MSADNTRQYLTFKLGSESFAIEITKVREVLDFSDVTKIPKTPDFMLGVINLRGNIVPVVDLGQSLGMPATTLSTDSCIVIIEILANEELLVVGALADSVEEVLEISNDAVGAPPKIGTRLKTEYLKGIGRRGDKFVMILDMDRVLSADELAAVGSTMSVVPDGAIESTADEVQIS